MTNVCFYQHYFYIQYNYHSRNYLLRFTVIFFLFKKCPNISNYAIFNSSVIIFFVSNFFFFFFCFIKWPDISNYSDFSSSFFFFSVKGFLMRCVFGLLSFFPLSYTVCLDVFALFLS